MMTLQVFYINRAKMGKIHSMPYVLQRAVIIILFGHICFTTFIHSFSSGVTRLEGVC